MFNITFLGTSSGIPTKERNVSAIAVELMATTHAKRHPWLLIDCGEGTQHQLLKSHLSPNDLCAILITHTHGDHCYGLAGLLASLGMHGRNKPLTLIAPKAIDKLLDALAVVSELHLNYPIEFMDIESMMGDNHDVSNAFTLTISNEHHITIDIHRLSHRCASYGFGMTQTLKKDKLLTDKLTLDNIPNIYWGKLLKSDMPIIINDTPINPHDYKTHHQSKLKIVIAGDNDTPELLTDAVIGATLLVHEATHTDEIRQKILARPLADGGFDPQHSSAKMVAQFAQAAGVPALALTHFSARYASFEDVSDHRPNMAHIRAEASQHYQGRLILAQDFMQVLITADNVDIV